MKNVDEYRRSMTSKKYLFIGTVKRIKPDGDIICEEKGTGCIATIDYKTNASLKSEYKKGDEIKCLIYPFIDVYFGVKDETI